MLHELSYTSTLRARTRLERNFTMLSSFITYQRVCSKSIYQLFLHSYSFFWLWNYLTFVTYKTLIYICSEFNSFSNKYLRRQITKVVLLERSNVTCKVSLVDLYIFFLSKWKIHVIVGCLLN